MLGLDFVINHPIICIITGALLFLILYIYRDPPKPTRHGSKEQFDPTKIKTPSATFEMIQTNGIHLHTLCAGDPKNPLVVLLHGFPEFWKGWELQVDDLVNAGYYVMVPDQRGYNLSSKPLNMGDYRITNMVNDIIGLLDFAKREKAYLAGHDWGAAVAWALAMLRPERFHKVVIVNVPHPVSFKWFYMNDKEQNKKSGYMRRFQIPYFPQRFAAKNNFEDIGKMLAKTALPGVFTVEKLKAYKLAWNDPGTFNCMLNWYRAAFQRPPKIPSEKIKVEIPVLIIWGAEDRFLKKEMAEHSLKYCVNGKVELIEGATHWVLHEKPEIVNKLMINFYKS